jgi:hypothetical protein
MNNLKNCSNKSQAFVRRESVLPKPFLRAYLFFLVVSIFIFSCGPSREAIEELEANASRSAAMTDSVSSYMKGIATDTINGITHNFIRNAHLKMKVNDVLSSSKKIEDLVFDCGGYVFSSKLTSNKNFTQSIQTHKDSVLEQINYTTVNQISLRIPNQKLDTVLRQICNLALFIDFKNLSADDVKMKLFANKLAENRYKNYKNNVQLNAKVLSTKLSQLISVEESLLTAQSMADTKRIESLDLADQVNYSTVIIETYQAEAIMKQLIAIQVPITPYEPSFYNKLQNSFVNGFVLLKNFILFLVNSWGLLLIALCIFFAVKRLVYYSNKSPKPLPNK